MRLDELARERQAEAERALAGRLHARLAEPVERLVDALRVHPEAIVGNDDPRPRRAAVAMQQDAPALRRRGDRMAQQMFDHLPEAPRIAADPAAGARKLDFAVELARSTGRVRGDPKRLKEVIEHLLRHAVASTPEGGRILLHADGSATGARIVVSDNGFGMDAESIARAFDRFGEPGMQPTGERALGLGLPLARQFVEAHGGRIDLVSQPGEGTLVTVELPRR